MESSTATDIFPPFPFPNISEPILLSFKVSDPPLKLISPPFPSPSGVTILRMKLSLVIFIESSMVTDIVPALPFLKLLDPIELSFMESDRPLKLISPAFPSP